MGKRIITLGEIFDKMRKTGWSGIWRGVSLRSYATSRTALELKLLESGCSSDDAALWSEEMKDWPEHSIESFLEKMAHIQASGKSVEQVAAEQVAQEKKWEEEEDIQDTGAYKNPETGEIGGPKGPEPTRYNDWSVKGRV